jgi:hypothetical protein
MTEHFIDQAQTVSRRVEKFAELMQSVWVSRNDYERRVRAVCPFFCNEPLCLTFILKLLRAIEETQAGWATIEFEGTYADAMNHSAQFSTYKQTIKRNWVTEKQDLATLFSNVQTKLRTYGLREYVPPPGLAPAVCNNPIICSHPAHSIAAQGAGKCVGFTVKFRREDLEVNKRPNSRVSETLS